MADFVTLAAFALAVLSVIAVYRSRARVQLEYWYDNEGHFDFQVIRSGQNPANNLVVDFAKRDMSGVARSGGDLTSPQTMIQEFRICGLSRLDDHKCEIERIDTYALHIRGADVVDFLVSWQSPVLLWRKTRRLYRFEVAQRRMSEFRGMRAYNLFNANTEKPN